MSVLLVVQLVLVGLLAGEEFIVRWGVQPAMAALPDDAHLRTRIALVKSLKVVVPMLMVPAVLASVAVLVLAGTGPTQVLWSMDGSSRTVDRDEYARLFGDPPHPLD